MLTPRKKNSAPSWRHGQLSERSMKPSPHSNTTSVEPLLDLDLPGVKKVKSGKVREMFDLGDCLLLVATDRISAFDCIMPNGIPLKGEILTQLSYFWFERFASIMPNHLFASASDPLPRELQPFAGKLSRRSM